MPDRKILVGLSTASVYPENTEAAFRYAAEVGYDGVELMVWAESVSQDVSAVQRLVRKYAVPVQAVHVPCLLISQRVWGADPIAKLDRSVATAEALGASNVVVHPPFRWQRRYADGFADQVAGLEEKTGAVVAVENMFPMRADSFFGGREKSAQRLRRRGGRVRRCPRSARRTTPPTPITGTTRWTCPTPRPRAWMRWISRTGWAAVWPTCTWPTGAARRSTSTSFPGTAASPASKCADISSTAGSPGRPSSRSTPRTPAPGPSVRRCWGRR